MAETVARLGELRGGGDRDRVAAEERAALARQAIVRAVVADRYRRRARRELEPVVLHQRHDLLRESQQAGIRGESGGRHHREA